MRRLPTVLEGPVLLGAKASGSEQAPGIRRGKHAAAPRLAEITASLPFSFLAHAL